MTYLNASANSIMMRSTYYMEKIADNRRGKFRQSIKEIKKMNILNGP